MRLMLETLIEHHPYAKLNKWEFYKDTIQYSGHIISKEGLSVDSKKVRDIMNWPIPKYVSAVHSFMEITR